MKKFNKNIKIGFTLIVYLLLINVRLELSTITTYIPTSNDGNSINLHSENSDTIASSSEEPTIIKDIVGHISISGTSIDEEIVQTKNNSYYLNHDKFGKSSSYGAIFMDYRNNKKSNKILIFGHNSSKNINYDQMPFRELENYYKNQNYYKKHKYINFTYDNESRKYEILSVYVETKDFTYMNLNFSNEKAYNEHINSLISKSDYTTDATFNDNDQILLLQTCSKSKDFKDYKEKYLLIIAKRIN